jgi:pimeloyl-ACP methyl ester carboxylesterase
MPYKTVNDVKLYYEVFGDKKGVPIVLNSGGQQGGEVMRDFARALKRPGVKFLLWDRRNSLGKSAVRFDDGLSRTMSEPEVQCEDLNELMKETKMTPAIMIGNSTGAYISLIMASKHPESVYGVVAMNTPGGPLAAEVMSHSFYGEYLRLARTAGMEAVMDAKFYADMIKLNPVNHFQQLCLLTRSPPAYRR